VPYKDPEKLREASAKYRAKNREKLLETNAKYYAENREKLLEQKAKYYAENREKIREYKAKYYAENREKLLEWQAKYQDTTLMGVTRGLREGKSPEEQAEILAQAEAILGQIDRLPESTTEYIELLERLTHA
jgi:hypothetical protein